MSVSSQTILAWEDGLGDVVHVPAIPDIGVVAPYGLLARPGCVADGIATVLAAQFLFKQNRALLSTRCRISFEIDQDDTRYFLRLLIGEGTNLPCLPLTHRR